MSQGLGSLSLPKIKHGPPQYLTQADVIFGGDPQWQIPVLVVVAMAICLEPQWEAKGVNYCGDREATWYIHEHVPYEADQCVEGPNRGSTWKSPLASMAQALLPELRDNRYVFNFDPNEPIMGHGICADGREKARIITLFAFFYA